MQFHIHGIFEILQLVENAKTKKEKIDLLRQLKSECLLSVLQGAFDARVVWDLPEGPVPFKASPGEGLETSLYKQSRQFYLFAKNAVPGLTALKRETLFVQLLESIHPKDAEILVHAKDKTLPYKTITSELVAEAFPELNMVPVKGKPIKKGKSETSFQEAQEQPETPPVLPESGDAVLEVQASDETEAKVTKNSTKAVKPKTEKDDGQE